MPKTTRPMVRIHDLATDEVIDREMTDAEFAQYEADQAAQAIAHAEAEAKAATRASAIEKLSALGLTTEEIAALTK
jgi:hypothetical protein